MIELIIPKDAACRGRYVTHTVENETWIFVQYNGGGGSFLTPRFIIAGRNPNQTVIHRAMCLKIAALCSAEACSKCNTARSNSNRDVAQSSNIFSWAAAAACTALANLPKSVARSSGAPADPGMTRISGSVRTWSGSWSSTDIPALAPINFVPTACKGPIVHGPEAESTP